MKKNVEAQEAGGRERRFHDRKEDGKQRMKRER